MPKHISAPLISFIGHSNSGKTASIENLIQFLTKNGWECSALKFIHQENFSMDQPGKNTWKYTQSGAKIVVAQSMKESTFLFNSPLSPNKILDWIYRIGIEEGVFKNPQKVIFLLEGFREVGDQQILCVNNSQEIVDQLTPTVKIIAGGVSNLPEETLLIVQKYHLPVINIIQNPIAICEYFHLKL
jgi:molybdopterin-guanine dinucleotide biosynthesis adapter protein